MMRSSQLVPLSKSLLKLFLGSAFLLTGFFGCGGPPSSQGGGTQSSSASGDIPEISDEMIRDRINYVFVRKIPEENGNGEPMNWTFVHEEPKEITVVERKIDGDRATILLDIKTRSGPRARGPRYLAGQIRTVWELRSGWVLRQWEIVDTENVSMKYRKLPDPTPNNSNLTGPEEDLDHPAPPAPNSNR